MIGDIVAALFFVVLPLALAAVLWVAGKILVTAVNLFLPNPKQGK